MLGRVVQPLPQVGLAASTQQANGAIKKFCQFAKSLHNYQLQNDLVAYAVNKDNKMLPISSSSPSGNIWTG